MNPSKPNPIDWLKQNLGITDKQASALMPDQGKSFPAAIIDPWAEEEPWAVREYKKDLKGWEHVNR